VIGGHDKGGNNGLRKISIFSPKTMKWLRRPIPPVRSEWEADPTGTMPHSDPLDETNTDPSDPSDMRWYPTAATLPDGKILILSGTDQDTSVGPDEASATKVRQAVPEVYDPKTDTTVALENARKLLPMYVRSFVVQTGPGWNDWKVAVTAEVEPPLPRQPGGPNIRGYDPFFYNGNTYLLDVLGALADPDINVPGEEHWTFVNTAASAHESGAGVRMVTIYNNHSWSQEVFLFGGDDGSGSSTVATAEKINFSDPAPKWQMLSDLVQPATQNKVVVLPNGKLIIVGGRGEDVNSLQYQMFDPVDGSRTDLITSPVPRHDHATALFQRNGGVWVMRGNRVNLIPGDPRTQAQRDASVPVLEFYKPPYFFKGPRPVIDEAPDRIKYAKTFKLEVSGWAIDSASPWAIGSVVLIRTGPITHNWTWGNQYVKLPFTKGDHGKLHVTAPPLPGLAIPGDYLLFVVTKGGIPSEGKHVRLKLKDEPSDELD
jgi:Galactose oxidase-like, Early set domain